MPASKFTPANRRKILDGLRKGKPLNAAVAGAGVGLTTFKDWRQKAETAATRAAGGEKITTADKGFVAFLQDVEDAIAVGVSWLYDRWLEEAEKQRRGNWMGYERMLRARFPSDFAAQIAKFSEAKPATITDAAAAELDLSKLTVAELRALRALVRKAAEEEPADGDQDETGRARLHAV